MNHSQWQIGSHSGEAIGKLNGGVVAGVLDFVTTVS